MSEKKRRQHHVWKYYLKAWATNGTVTCLMAGKPFSTDPDNLAVEGDFYKLVKLTEDDLSFIRKFVIDPNPRPSGKRVHENFLELLTRPDRVVDAHRGNIANIEEVEEALDIFRTNVLEDGHAGTERSFFPLLEMIHRNDVSFYDDNAQVIHFLHYICTQHMRTKGIKSTVIASFKAFSDHDISRTWDILSHMFAVNIGASLYAERRERKLILLANNTGIDFITGDQPVINLNGRDKTPPETMVYYYPVAPSLALILTEVDGVAPFTSDSLTASEVRHLNARMAKASHQQIFGRSEAVLHQAQADAVSL